MATTGVVEERNAQLARVRFADAFLAEAFENEADAPATPSVDFAHRSVLVRRLGVQTRRGSSIVIDSLKIAANGDTGYAHAEIPGPECESESLRYTPWTAVDIPKDAISLSWELTSTHKACPPIAFVPAQVWHGVGAPDYFRFQRRQVFLISRDDSLRAFWSVAHWNSTPVPQVPTVNFDVDVVFVASAGWTSGCTSVAADSFLVRRDAIEALVSVWYPSGNYWWCTYTFSRPWGAAVIPAPQGAVETSWRIAYY